MTLNDATKNELKLQAARYSFGLLGTEDIQRTVNRLLNEGIYVDEFLEIIHPETLAFEIIGKAFEKALSKLGIGIPSFENSVWLLLYHHIFRIAIKTNDALKELDVLMSDIYQRYDFGQKTTQFLGDSHGIEQLIGLFWSCDDLIARPTEVSFRGKYGMDAIEEVKKEIVLEAKKWLKNNAQRIVALASKGYCKDEATANE